MNLFNLKSLVLPLIALVVVSMLFTACRDDDTDLVPTTLSETLETYPDLSRLVEALEATSLISQLNGATVTVFAPTNEAFDTFLMDEGYGSINDVPVGDLKNLLLNHVLDGYVTSDALNNGYVTTLAEAQGHQVSMKVDIDQLLLNNSSKITSVDIDGLTGVIHVVDAVVAIPNVVDIAINDGNFTNLVESLSTVELVNTLQENGPFTIFAPNDAAIQWSTSMGLSLDILREILSDHVVNGNIHSADLSDNQLIETIGQSGSNSYTIRFGADGTTQIIETGSSPDSIIARITMTDIQGSNGVVHMINNIIVL